MSTCYEFYRCGTEISFEDFENEFKRHYIRRIVRAERLNLKERVALSDALETLLFDPEDAFLSQEDYVDSVTTALCLLVSGGRNHTLARALLKKSSPVGCA